SQNVLNGELKTITGIKLSSSVFGMEQTGIYSSRLISVLEKSKANIVHQDSNHIKNSLGSLRGKNDKIDAIRIATYLFKSKSSLVLWRGRREVIIELSSLSTLRNRLAITMRSLKVPLKEDRLFISERQSVQNSGLCSSSIAALASDIDSIDARIRQVWSSDDAICRLMERITSIPCIGEMTALQIIISTNEFRTITSPKQFASYAGVAPFPYQSGTSILGRTRVSHMANKKVKTLLHTCAVLSVRFVPEIKAYFARKTQQENKHRMLVFNAVRNKLILRVFACVKQDRNYHPGYSVI
ncbi:MAG: IS110 family transposase, partial [Sphingobacteriales bacterium]